MPSPPAMSRQLSRSSGVAWVNRGYQSSGTEIVRPSESSAVSVSPEIVTVSASGTLTSSVETLIPRLNEQRVVLHDGPRDPPHLGTASALRCVGASPAGARTWRSAVAPHLDMRRFLPIARVEEEAVGPLPQYRRHLSTQSIGRLPAGTGRALTTSDSRPMISCSSVGDRAPSEARQSNSSAIVSHASVSSASTMMRASRSARWRSSSGSRARSRRRERAAAGSRSPSRSAAHSSPGARVLSRGAGLPQVGFWPEPRAFGESGEVMTRAP